ncbi:MAG: ABC transporter permease [Chloroflexota bacterium]|nr:ABC transporter permease [Chloroflexota bacterium]
MAVAGVRHLEHNLLVYRRVWRGSAFSTVLSPILFLTAMGVALGSFVPQMTSFGGVSYLAFLAPGLLAAQAMQTATLESTWPLLAGFRWLKTFEATIATPQRPRDIVLGHLYWQIVRVGIVTAIFLLVMTVFGAVTSPLTLLAWPAAILTGLAFGMPLAAWTATRREESSFAIIFRFLITPLFLFSGTFFPIDRLPDFIEPVAWLTPLFHGVTLTRSLALGQALDPVALLVHVSVLVALVVVGTALAFRTFRQRLVV